jgi:type IV pilus assembly protein PilB
VQVNHKAGLTFAAVLPAILRSDPDIVLIGEIRDRATAQLGIEAALTGHLVLSTLHTNDAPSAVTRLVEMGIEPFLVGSSLDCVLAQRLARRLCQWCKETYAPTEVEGRPIDLRVATLPCSYGENVVMRILDQSKVMIELDELGMLPQALERFTKAFSQAHGAVLVTGPTGSGKSTTLYAALTALNTIEKNIITIEDPVEYQLDGITQVQVNPRAGLHFHTGLRSMMRADPDIIMVGEIRDRETAQIAIESALTGHLVLSTLHTNDAASAVTRLVDMGVEPFLVASAIDCVVGQRLARKLCQHCKERGIITADVLRANGIRSQFDMEAYQPTGCARCNHTGYKGRIGLYEVMIVSEEIRKLTLARAPAPEIAEVAVRQGMRLMRDDGLEKVRHGMTSIAEVTRVTGSGAAAVEA